MRELYIVEHIIMTKQYVTRGVGVSQKHSPYVSVLVWGFLKKLVIDYVQEAQDIIWGINGFQISCFPETNKSSGKRKNPNHI